MSTDTIVAKYVNNGISNKNGKPYHNIKTADDRIFWSTRPLDPALQGAAVVVTYDVGKNGSFNILSVTPAGQNGIVEKQVHRPTAAPVEANNMAVMAIFKGLACAGLVGNNATDIAAALKNAADGYHLWKLGVASAKYKVQSSTDDDDMEDEIPF